MEQEDKSLRAKILQRRDGLFLNNLVNVLGASIDNLFSDQHKTPYVRIKKKTAEDFSLDMIGPIKGRDFKSLITQTAYKRFKVILRSGDLKAIVEYFYSAALTSGKQYEMFLRTAYDGTKLWYDLRDWRAVCISAEKWKITDYPPPLFVSYRQKKQQEPIKSRKIEEDISHINKLISFFPFTEDPDLALIFKGYIITSFIPDIPRPILFLYGAQGSGKTTMFKLLRSLIDPSDVSTLSITGRAKEFIQAAAHNYCVFLDNMNQLPDWLADYMCRLCTGESIIHRELYTDDGDFVITYKRMGGYNGISLPAIRSDLLDRSLIIEAPIMPDRMRKTEKDIITEFDNAKGHILGAIFSTISRAMQIRNTEKSQHYTLPRLADFGLWAEVISQALCYPAGIFLETYRRLVQKGHNIILGEHPLAIAVERFTQDKGEHIRLNASVLHHQLTEVAHLLNLPTNKKPWPEGSNWLWKRLQSIEPNLRSIGICVSKEITSDGSFITIRKLPIERGGN